MGDFLSTICHSQFEQYTFIGLTTMPSPYLTQLRKWMLESPPVEWGINQLRELLIGALRQGSIPQHVAFVMDGNRRFARSHKIETVEGHNLGFEALAKILEVCYKSGVKVVTVYAFSIENFKRSKYEVDALMDMAKIKLSQLSQHGELLDRYGASVRVLGNRDLLRPDVLQVIDKAVDMTKNNGTCALNICFPYTSRDEITSAQVYSRGLLKTSTSSREAIFSDKNHTKDSFTEPEHLTSPLKFPFIRHRRFRFFNHHIIPRVSSK